MDENYESMRANCIDSFPILYLEYPVNKVLLFPMPADVTANVAVGIAVNGKLLKNGDFHFGYHGENGKTYLKLIVYCKRNENPKIVGVTSWAKSRDTAPALPPMREWREPLPISHVRNSQ